MVKPGIIYHKDTRGNEEFFNEEEMIRQEKFEEMFKLGLLKTPYCHAIHYGTSVFEGVRAVSDIDNGKPFRYKWKHWITKRYKYFIRNYSFIYNRWRNFYHTVIKKPTEEEKFAESERRFLEEGQMKNLGNDEWALKDELSVRSHRGLKLAEENMSKFLEVCKNKSIEDVYIVVYPWPNNILNANKEILYTLYWERFAKEKHLKFINLFPVFINEKLLIPSETVKKYYIDGDCHWNSNGHRLVADEILKQLGARRQKHL